MTNAILINPEDKTLTKVTFGGWKGINTLIGCRTFTLAPFTHSTVKDEATLFVDDEGLFNKGSVCFHIGDDGAHLFGKGLFLGSNDEGESVDSPLSVEELAEIVDFDRQMFVLDPDSLTIASCNDYPIVVSYKTDEDDWCFYARTENLHDAYNEWTNLEESGIEFNAIKIEKK